MFEEFHMRRRQNKERIDKFWKERPEGYKLCPECFLIFNTDGFPAEGSWSCSEWCFESCNMRNPPIIPQDTISRIYLITNPSFSVGEMPAEKPAIFSEETEKAIHKMLTEENEDE